MSQTVQPLISQYKLKKLSSSHLIQSSFCSPSNIFSVSILFLFPADEPRELWKSNNPRAINPTSGHRPIQSDFSFTLFSSQHIANSTSILLFSPPEKKKKRENASPFHPCPGALVWNNESIRDPGGPYLGPWLPEWLLCSLAAMATPRPANSIWATAQHKSTSN